MRVLGVTVAVRNDCCSTVGDKVDDSGVLHVMVILESDSRWPSLEEDQLVWVLTVLDSPSDRLPRVLVECDENEGILEAVDVPNDETLFLLRAGPAAGPLADETRHFSLRLVMWSILSVGPQSEWLPGLPYNSC